MQLPPSIHVRTCLSRTLPLPNTNTTAAAAAAPPPPAPPSSAMSKPSSHSRSKSASDVRRTLFRTLSRAGGASSSATNLNLASPPRESAEDHEARVVASEGIVVRNEDGTMDLEVPLSASQHAQLLESVEQESDVHMRRETAELVKRHQVDLKQRLPELLRMQVLSLAQDNWMFESDEEN